MTKHSIYPEGDEYYAPQRFTLRDFVRESNKIEGIHRDPTDAELREAFKFINLPKIRIIDLICFVGIYQPDAVLRNKAGLNVRVGSYLPPAGSPKIKTKLQDLLDEANEGGIDPYVFHHEYEALHPFTDCNGRSGRILWLWARGGSAPLGFLHSWYYESLAHRDLIPIQL